MTSMTATTAMSDAQWLATQLQASIAPTQKTWPAPDAEFATGSDGVIKAKGLHRQRLHGAGVNLVTIPKSVNLWWRS
jgi:hypothetical protein